MQPHNYEIFMVHKPAQRTLLHFDQFERKLITTGLPAFQPPSRLCQSALVTSSTRKFEPMYKLNPFPPNLVRLLTSFALFTGDIVYFHSDQSPCVFPSGRRDYTANIIGCAAARKIFDIRHDPRINKVRTTFI